MSHGSFCTIWCLPGTGQKVANAVLASITAQYRASIDLYNDNIIHIYFYYGIDEEDMARKLNPLKEYIIEWRWLESI